MIGHYPMYHRIDPPCLDSQYKFFKDREQQRAYDAKRKAEIDKLSPERGQACRLFEQHYAPKGLAYTDRDLLPDLTAFDSALAEDNLDDAICRSGRYLYGASGTGKTRCAVKLASNYLLHGLNVSWWSAYDLKQQLFALRNDADKKKEFVDTLSRDDCELFVDDLGHQLSEPYLEVIRVILDNRGDNRLVITSQFSLDEFVERCHGKDMGRLGEAVARRLFDLCQRIEFRRGRKVADAVPVKTEPVPACAAKPTDSEKAPAM